MAEATVDETSLVGIFGRECPSPARDRLTTVPTAAISARASVQSFELEQQFALGAVQGERENEAWDETLALPCGHCRSTNTNFLGTDGRKQTIDRNATSHPISRTSWVIGHLRMSCWILQPSPGR